tara:strand:+ start:108 stop:827 length:720 start_codon:yes stop_codon:yes gene_type:complete
MSNHKNTAIEAATDGACSGNPGNGGWGGLIIFNDGSELEIGGSEENTTNNRMELMAAIKILEKLKEYEIVKNFPLRSDSKYLIEGYTKWIKNWKKNGWRTSTGKPVQNLDLWQKIDLLRLDGLKMEFVKGHSGDKYNERVDLIATQYSKGITLKNNQQNAPRQRISMTNTAPLTIRNLYSRIDLVNEFANKGYLLKSDEICELLAIKTDSTIKNFQEFEWRNWIIQPTNNNYWKIIPNN